MSSDAGVQPIGTPLRLLARALLLDVAARLLFVAGLVGTIANMLAEEALRLPPRVLFVAGLSGVVLMLVTESCVFNLREQLGLRARGRLWSVTSSLERAALHSAGMRRLELIHRTGTMASWSAVGAGVVLGLIGLLNP